MNQNPNFSLTNNKNMISNMVQHAGTSNEHQKTQPKTKQETQTPLAMINRRKVFNAIKDPQPTHPPTLKKGMMALIHQFYNNKKQYLTWRFVAVTYSDGIRISKVGPLLELSPFFSI